MVQLIIKQVYTALNKLRQKANKKTKNFDVILVCDYINRGGLFLEGN